MAKVFGSIINRACKVVEFSARVASIRDNRLRECYSYCASKTLLMLMTDMLWISYHYRKVDQ